MPTTTIYSRPRHTTLHTKVCFPTILFLTLIVFAFKDIRNEYSNFLDANYALAQAQMNNAALASCSKAKATCERKDGDVPNSSAVASWNRNAEWNLQQAEMSSNNFFGQPQYQLNAAKNYWA